MTQKNIIEKELRLMLDETYDLNLHMDNRLKRYATHMGQNWKDLKEYFLINTDGSDKIYYNAVDRFLSSEGF